jgi:hypothetical protein
VIVVSEVSNMKSFAGMVLVLALSSVVSQAQTPAADAGNPANKSPSGMPTVQHHLETAKDIHAKVSGQSDDRDKNRRN